MIQKTLTATISLLALAASLTACGGGGDDNAGSPTAFSVSPDTISWSASAGSTSCLTNFQVGVFQVLGGAAPYRLQSSQPSEVILSTSQVNSRGGTFTVTLGPSGNCYDPATITVRDALDHTVTVTIISKIGT